MTLTTSSASRVGLMITTAGTARTIPLPAESGLLKTFQAAVGGLIDVITFPSLNLALVINDEGKLIGLPVNPTATALYCLYHGVFDVVAGDVVAIEAGTGPDGESIGLRACAAAHMVRLLGLRLV
jgi:hypothetical protein